MNPFEFVISLIGMFLGTFTVCFMPMFEALREYFHTGDEE